MLGWASLSAVIASPVTVFEFISISEPTCKLLPEPSAIVNGFYS